MKIENADDKLVDEAEMFSSYMI